MRRALGPFLAALAVLSLAGSALVRRAEANPPPEETVHYEIRRNGDAIGTHRAVFSHQGDRFTVEHTIRIRVTILSLEAYRYEMDSRETWEGDRLLGLHANTDRNGDPLAVFVRASSSAMRIRAPAGRREAPTHAVPSSPQHDVFSQPRSVMIEAEDGRLLDVSVSGPSSEMIRYGRRAYQCRRYEVTGDLEATLWYAPNGILMRKRLTAPDGSTVMTVRI